MIAYAADSAATAAAKGLLAKIEANILTPLISLMLSVAFLYFLWGAYEFVSNADSEGGRETGKQHMLYGIIGMLVMFSALAILKIAAGTFGIDIPS